MSTSDSGPGPEKSFASLFFREMLLRAGLVLVAMGMSFLGSWVGDAVGGDSATAVGAFTGLLLGILLAWLVLRRRR